ncbi:hypothetical protein PMI01_03839 [Caulobacter sp. AP07]|uniref:DUF6572 domain-containing protein n=1 Tax=Caulobacter sp. AP07 TaxID=1144304 RepID=UPI0002720C71|nr:DUF6572 domain-containing protein [Caulobacter sp. AP07]EJL27358.1 hypothetical protein PMI01_03839 [Caulobacter sp. AP07]
MSACPSGDGLDLGDLIDAVDLEPVSDMVVLTILDPGRWEDADRSLRTLENKLDACIAFIVDLEANYPDAAGRSRRIDVVTRHALDDAGQRLIEHAASLTLIQLGVDIRYRRQQ